MSTLIGNYLAQLELNFELLNSRTYHFIVAYFVRLITDYFNIKRVFYFK